MFLISDSPAPVEIIRGLASEFLDHQSPKERHKYSAQGHGDDIVSKGIVTESQAQELLDMFTPLVFALTSDLQRNMESGLEFFRRRHYYRICEFILLYC
jgi:hypothetical protein